MAEFLTDFGIHGRRGELTTLTKVWARFVLTFCFSLLVLYLSPLEVLREVVHPAVALQQHGVELYIQLRIGTVLVQSINRSTSCSVPRKGKMPSSGSKVRAIWFICQ
jgi:hypothetical protein